MKKNNIHVVNIFFLLLFFNQQLSAQNQPVVRLKIIEHYIELDSIDKIIEFKLINKVNDLIKGRNKKVLVLRFINDFNDCIEIYFDNHKVFNENVISNPISGRSKTNFRYFFDTKKKYTRFKLISLKKGLLAEGELNLSCSLINLYIAEDRELYIHYLD